MVIKGVNENKFSYTMGHDKLRVSGHDWYRGETCNYMPTQTNLNEKNSIDQYIIGEWAPGQKLITKDDTITAFGSCFARHVNKFLKNKGYKTGEVAGGLKNVKDSYVVHFGSGIVNTFALRQQFEWAYEGRDFDENLWYGSRGELAEATEEIKQKTKDVFDNTTVFILTLGLSEVWCNKQTGEVFWRGIPIKHFDKDLHGFRLSSVDENYNNIIRVIEIIKKHLPNAKIIFSLSPVPLLATFRDMPCITADCVSKSILRVALDMALQKYSKEDHIYYWPSYEIVKYYFDAPYEEDKRHIKQEVVDTIMNTFQRHYMVPLRNEEKVVYE